MPSQKHGATASNLKADASRPSPSLDGTLFPAKKSSDDFQGWQDAVERMQLYLKTLQLTPEEQLGLALEALRRASAQWGKHTDPPAACLQALWQILRERSRPIATKVDVGGCNDSPWAAPKLLALFNATPTISELAQPSIRRQCMLSAPMELAPWRRRIQELIATVRNPTETLLYRRGAVIGALLALGAMLALK